MRTLPARLPLIPVLALAGSLCPAPALAALPTGFADQTIVTGLNQPCGMTFLPDGRLLVTEQITGRIQLVVGGQVSPVGPVMTVDSLDTGFFEQGLLGIAVDPGWPMRPYIYVHYDHSPDNRIRISRYTLSGQLSDARGDTLAGDPAGEHVLIADIPDNAGNHNGGTLRFGTDGMLYASLGEDAVPCAAQDTSTGRGVILRLDVSRLPPGPGLAAKDSLVPPGNPYAGPPNSFRRLTWVIGLRNPFRFHVDPADGALLIADVGSAVYEEVSRAGGPGLNFGWPMREGPGAGPNSSCPGVVPGPLTDPIANYNRTGFPGGASIISGGLYRPEPGACEVAFPSNYVGDYFFLDYYEGFLRRIKGSGSTWVRAFAPGQPNLSDWGTEMRYTSDFAVGPDGALWYLRQFDDALAPSSGSIHRIVAPPGPPRVTAPPPDTIAWGDTVTVTFAIRNTSGCARRYAYAFLDPESWIVAASAPLTGITPPVAPGSDALLDVSLAFTPPCDALSTGIVALSSSPAGFPDSTVADTMQVRCSSSVPALVTGLVAAVEDGVVRLDWNASDPSITGFHVDRAATPAGPYTRLTSAPIPPAGATAFTFRDSTVSPGRVYFYHVTVVVGGLEYVSGLVPVTTPPLALSVGRPYPNPAADAATVRLYLTGPAAVVAEVRDLAGRRVRRIEVGAVQPFVTRFVQWDGRDDTGQEAPAGIYTLEIQAGGQRVSRRVARIR